MSLLNFLHINRCSRCTKTASRIEISPENVLKYEGPGGSNGSGRQIPEEEASAIKAMFTSPLDPAKLKKHFYDRAGLCRQCLTFFCGHCWNINNGFGNCPAGHGESLDPHWTPDD